MFQKAFAEAGDHKTAQVLQIVHDEEIGHVRLAKTWLNKLEKSSDDLANYKKKCPFLLARPEPKADFTSQDKPRFK